MPVNPSPELMQHLFGAPPQLPALPGINGPMPVAQSTLPSWMRQGFEGGVDAAQGMLGFGDNNSRMNQVGQLGMAALPVMGGIKGMMGAPGLASRINTVPQISPSAEEVESLIAQMANNMKSVPNSRNIPIQPPSFPNGRFGGHLAPNLGPMDFPPQNRVAMFGNPGVMDEMGRNVAPPQAPIDPAYQAHVASSVGKFQNTKPQGYAPGPDHIEQLMSKYKK